MAMGIRDKLSPDQVSFCEKGIFVSTLGDSQGKTRQGSLIHAEEEGKRLGVISLSIPSREKRLTVIHTHQKNFVTKREGAEKQSS
jgi:hypothetical protein